MTAADGICAQLTGRIMCESQSHKATRATAIVVSDSFVLSGGDSDVVDSAGAQEHVVEGGRIVGRLTGGAVSSSGDRSRASGIDTKMFILLIATDCCRSGKINLDGAAAQAMQSLSERKSTATSTEDRHDPAEDLSFDLQLIANGNIRLETMSWMEAIRRKHGFMDESQGTPPPRSPGRTASAKVKAEGINPALVVTSTEQ